MCYSLNDPENHWKVLKLMSSGNKKSRSPHTLKMKNESLQTKYLKSAFQIFHFIV